MTGIKLRDANKNYQQYGDIILTKSNGIISKANRLGQRALKGKKSSYTHALLCLNPGCFIEATFGSELLAFDYKNNEISSLDSEEWKVIRYKHLKSKLYDTDFHNAVYEHLGKAYSIINKDDKTFCSSFIAMVYNSFLPDSNLFKNVNSTLPVTLEFLTDNSANWDDVTEDYQKIEKDFTVKDDAIRNITQLFNLQYESVKRTVEVQKIVDSISNPIKLQNNKTPDTNKTYENWIEK